MEFSHVTGSFLIMKVPEEDKLLLREKSLEDYQELIGVWKNVFISVI